MTGPRPSHNPPQVFASRQAQVASPRLGRYDCELLGVGCVGVGVSPTLGSQPCTLDKIPSPGSSPSLGRGQGCIGQGGSRPAIQAGSRGDLSPRLSGFLRTAVRDPQVVGRVETGSRPLPTQQISAHKTVSHGDSGLHSRIHPIGRLGDVSRPVRRLFSRPRSPEGQKVVAFPLEGQDSTVSGAPIRAFTGPVGVHSYCEGILPVPEEARHSHPGVPGRLAYSSHVFPGMQPTYPDTAKGNQYPWFFCQLPQVGVSPFPGIYFPGYGFQYSVSDGTPCHAPHPQAQGPPLGFAQTLPCLGEGSHFSPGHDGVVGSVAAFGQASQKGVSTPVQGSLVADQPSLGLSSATPALAERVHHTVVGQRVVASGGPHQPSTSDIRALHGCLPLRVGSTHGPSDCCRSVVQRAGVVAYQCLGDGGSVSGSPGVCFGSREPSCPSPHRQHYGGLLCEQTGGGTVTDSLLDGRGSAEMVRCQQRLSDGQACARQVQHCCRSAQPSTPDPSHGMDTDSSGSQTRVGDVVHTDGRLVRDSVQLSSSVLRLPGSRSGSVEGGRAVLPVGRSERLRVPALAPSGQGAAQGSTRPSTADSRGSQLARSAVVSRAPGALPRSSSQAVDTTQVSASTPHRGPAREPRHAQPSRMASLRRSLLSRGATPHTIELVLEAHCPSTQRNYESRWKRWFDWTKAHNISLTQPRRTHLANFLSHLSCVEGLSAASVMSHLSAVRTTIRQMGFPPLEDDMISGVIKAVNKRRDAQPRRIPNWDLSIVLEFLRGPVFSSPGELSLKLLSLKTCFLVSLATARRSCEVHALSGLLNDVSFEPDGSVSLRFLPEFRAKTHRPGDQSPLTVVKPLTSILAPDDADRDLCPVRSLRRYLRRSRPLRSPTHRRLFVSLNPGNPKDVRKSTLARWLVTVIKMAYTAANRQIDHPRAHEIRAWSTSLALEHNVPTQLILAAASWRSVNTFTDFYLRDVTRESEDGTHGIAACVVANFSTPVSAPSVN